MDDNGPVEDRCFFTLYLQSRHGGSTFGTFQGIISEGHGNDANACALAEWKMG